MWSYSIHHYNNIHKDGLSSILGWFNNNQGLAQWLLLLLTSLGLYVAFREFVQKRRPYIAIEIEKAKNPNKQQGGWLFFGRIINKGNFPGVARVEYTLMRVGDEEFPGKVDYEMIIFPGDSKKSALIGSIYNVGIKKILGNKYKNNKVEIQIRVISKEIDAKNFKYETFLNCEIDVFSKDMSLILVREEFK